MKKFTLHGREEVAFEQAGHVLVSATDTGAGMSPNQLTKLFREGIQFDVNTQQGGKGSGLGLYIAKGIVEQHGGSLVADSGGLGCGTTFTVKLPLYHVPDESLPFSLKHLRLVHFQEESIDEEGGLRSSS
jgi:signal transduction histidine kinase